MTLIPYLNVSQKGPIAMGFIARVISLCSYVNILRFWKQMIEHVFTIGLISKKNNQLQTEWKIIISERNHQDYLYICTWNLPWKIFVLVCTGI